LYGRLAGQANKKAVESLKLKLKQSGRQSGWLENVVRASQKVNNELAERERAARRCHLSEQAREVSGDSNALARHQLQLTVSTPSLPLWQSHLFLVKITR